MTTLPDRLLACAETLNEIADDTRGHALNGEQHDALREAAAALSVRVPEGDMARALEWLRYLADKRRVGVIPTRAREYLPVFEEAIAAYDPKAGGKTALSGGEAVAWGFYDRLGHLRIQKSSTRQYTNRTMFPLYTIPQPGDGWNATDDDVRAWLARHDHEGMSLTDARTMFDDARSAHMLPAAPSAKGVAP